MPELPEVQAVINELKSDLIGKRITDFELHWHRTLQKPSLKEFQNKIINREINNCCRYGKWIILNLDSGDVLIHLGMSGKLYYSIIPPAINKYIRAEFQIDQGSLIFEDVRKFGRILFVETYDPDLFKLGKDFLDPKLEGGYLLGKFKNTKRNIKALLLDQSIIAGLGNIYVDEILWACRIYPKIYGMNLAKNQLRDIITFGREIISKAIENRGTSILSFEVKSGEPGRFQRHLKVYGREGKNCFRCDEQIIKIRAAGRGTYLCPSCQVK